VLHASSGVLRHRQKLTGGLDSNRSLGHVFSSYSIDILHVNVSFKVNMGRKLLGNIRSKNSFFDIDIIYVFLGS
jgi:hypothetical protein